MKKRLLFEENSEEWVVEYYDEDGPESATFESEGKALNWIRVQQARTVAGEKFDFRCLYVRKVR